MDPDINQQLLVELRGMRRLIQHASITAIVLLVVLISLITLFQLPFRSRDPYGEVANALRQGNYRHAIELGQKIAAEHPTDYSAQAYLGSIYVGAGEWKKAEEAYSRAYAIYPSDNIKRIISTLQKEHVSLSPSLAGKSPEQSSPSATPPAIPLPSGK